VRLTRTLGAKLYTTITIWQGGRVAVRSLCEPQRISGRPEAPILPGEVLNLRNRAGGKDKGQGVAYSRRHNGGVNQAQQLIGPAGPAQVTSLLQTGSA